MDAANGKGVALVLVTEICACTVVSDKESSGITVGYLRGAPEDGVYPEVFVPPVVMTVACRHCTESRGIVDARIVTHRTGR